MSAAEKKKKGEKPTESGVPAFAGGDLVKVKGRTSGPSRGVIVEVHAAQLTYLIRAEDGRSMFSAHESELEKIEVVL